MRNLTTCLITQRLHALALVSCVAVISLLLAPGSETPVVAQEKSSKDISYKAYTASEISTALKRPLSLNDCIGIALSKNLTLQLSQKDLDRAEATHTGSYGTFLPTFSVEGTKENTLLEEPDSSNQFVESRFDNNAVVTGSVQQYLPTGATVTLTGDVLRDVSTPFGESTTRNQNRVYTLSLSQPLLKGAGPAVATAPVRSANYERESLEDQFENTRLRTMFSVKQVYYRVLLQRGLVKVNQAAVQSDSMLVRASEALLLANQASRRDVLSAQIRYADDKAALITSQTEYQTALDELKFQMGVPIEAPLELVNEELAFKPVQLNEPALIQRAMIQNPSVLSLEWSVRRSRLQHGVAKNSLLPQLNLVASYSTNRETDLVDNLDLRRTGGWQASLSLSYPFLNMEAGASAENAQIAISQLEDRLVNTQRDITLSIREIVRSSYSTVEEMKAITRFVEASQEKLEFARAMFNLGRASNLDLTDAQEALLKAQNQYLRKLVDYYTGLALLESLTGQSLLE